MSSSFSDKLIRVLKISDALDQEIQDDLYAKQETLPDFKPELMALLSSDEKSSLEHQIKNASKGVTEGTDAEYRW